MNAPIPSLDKQFDAFAPKLGEGENDQLVSACSAASNVVKEFLRYMEEQTLSAKKAEMVAVFGNPEQDYKIDSSEGRLLFTP